LRQPIGKEWGTKEVVQRNTRPRVVVKPGAVIEAMERPLL
jgi:U3 small nucleolar RNA-associated protein 14